jgi:lipopolysaccharide biosynthesis glycosyltransferase
VRRKVASTVRGGARRDGAGTGTTAAKTPGASYPDAWYVGEWNRLARAAFGPDLPDRAQTVDPAKSRDAVRRIGALRAQTVLAEAIARGEPIERAVCAAVAALAEAEDWAGAWGLAEGIGRAAGGTTASVLGHALLLHRRRQPARAWTRARTLDDATLAAFIPVEAVDAALADGSADARRRALAIGTSVSSMDAAALVDVAGRLLVSRERPATSALIAELRGRASVELDERRRRSWTLIEGWLEPRPVAVPAGAIPVGVLGYQTPDHVLTSGNLGDYIQTLAMVGNLVRLVDVTFTGEDGLGELATELQGRVQAGLRLPGVPGSVHLVPVNRDFSSADAIPEGTWMVAFGWHMHSLFDLRSDFPYHPNIRPLFLSFHVNRLEMLSEEALAYLRRYGPVGCRDWNTVHLLLGAGVDAFFSGCVTTTVGGLFPEREAAYRGKGSVGLIDMLPRPAERNLPNLRQYSHQSDEWRSLPMADGLRAASTALAAYQRDLERAVTTRLHAYLPLVSLGIPVEFRGRNAGDVRFAGLTGLRPGDARLGEIQGAIRDLAARLLTKILSGAAETEVYDLWRDLTRDRVAEAKARFAAPLVVPQTTIDVGAAVAASLAGRRRFGPHDTVDAATVADLVLCYDQNLLAPAAVLLESIVANASGPLRLWVLGRGLPDAYQDWLGAAFPTLPITFLPCDRVTYGAAGRPRRLTSRITISTMDRLLLPHMLDGVPRVTYVDVDTLMLDDVCRLASVDLGGRPVAARDSNVSEASEWRRSATQLPEDTATDLRRWMLQQHGYGAAALNAGVLVMDLDRMRRDDFTATYLGWVEAFGLHDQDTMLAYVGPDRCALDGRWNAMPVHEDVTDPGLIHWASLGKPWEPRLTYEQERWRAYADRLRQRAGVPPAGELVAGPAD